MTSQRLVQKLVQQAGIGSSDTVVDIGAGRGIITAELARVAKRVIAVEKDPRLASALRRRFGEIANVEIVERDFMRYRIPVREFKVFANLPYNQTTAIVRKLIGARVAEAHLIVQMETARRFSGVNMFSLLARPYYEFKIVHHLRRTDFHPVPSVDSVVLRMTRRELPLIQEGYSEFVAYGFRRHKPDLRLAYKEVFTYTQWKRIAHELGFKINSTATQLSFKQWIGLYNAYSQLSRRRDF